MKALLPLAGLVAICLGSVVPPVPRDNSHYVDGESRYVWIPDAEGNPHLVDLQKPVNEEFLKAKNGAFNQYWLYTRQNPNSPQFLVQGNANSVWNSNYSANRQTKVIVHGWNGSGNANMNTEIKNAFLAVLDCNVIVVDWSRFANEDYSTAGAAVRSVGDFLGDFLIWLFNTTGGNWNSVHLVGFSLGAHVVGNAGRRTGARVNRVTGLDPAKPGWTSSANALSTNAGQYVEAIHTEGSILGIFNPIAHADFYPNGGTNQPGCGFDINCSHGRAPELFAATVTFNHLIGRRCNNIWEAELSSCNGATLHMGNANLSKRGSGLYGLITGSSWPF